MGGDRRRAGFPYIAERLRSMVILDGVPDYLAI